MALIIYKLFYDSCIENDKNCMDKFYCTEVKNKYICVDINECLVNNGNCGDNYKCINTIGSFICLRKLHFTNTYYPTINAKAKSHKNLVSEKLLFYL